MAIDLFIMPLTRYWSGDFVTPAMRFAWQLGSSYKVVTPNGVIDCPPDQPFGGPEAAEKRRTLLGRRDLLDGIAALSREPMWNEEAHDDDIGDWRLDPRAYQAYLAQVDGALTRPTGTFARLLGKRSPPPHLCCATLLLPFAFDKPAPFDGVVRGTLGSLLVAARELAQVRASPEGEPAAAMLGEAIAEAQRRRLPLIIDA